MNTLAVVYGIFSRCCNHIIPDVVSHGEITSNRKTQIEAKTFRVALIFEFYRYTEVVTPNRNTSARSYEKTSYDSVNRSPENKVHGANMGPIWGRQDPGGPHVGPMNFAIWKPKDPFYLHGLTVISAWISGHIHNKVWDEITYPSPNVNSCTIEVWEWKTNLILHSTGHVITHPCWD